MNKNREERLKANEKKLLNIGIINAPGVLMLAVGLSTKFSGEIMHPILEKESVVNTLLFIGGVSMLWAIFKIIALWKEKIDIKNERGV